MKAVLLVEPGQLVVDDVAQPDPGPGDVRVAVGGVGICGSDMNVFRGKWPAPTYPWIQGHEAFGRIEAVGSGIDPARLGEVVVIEPNVPCGQCDPCRRGLTSSCRNRQSLGMNRPGALAEMVVVPNQHAWQIHGPPAVDLVCVEPLTVIETALRRLAAAQPQNALVVGVGSQGLLACLALVSRDVPVYALDVNPARVAFAATLGAKPLRDETPPAAIDLVIDTAGSAASLTTALEHAAIGGTIITLGLNDQPFEISAQLLVRRQLTIRGSLTYDHPDGFRTTVAKVQGGVIAPGRVISDVYPIDEAQRAFDACDAAAGKTWIRLFDQADPVWGSADAIATAARSPSR